MRQEKIGRTRQEAGRRECGGNKTTGKAGKRVCETGQRGDKTNVGGSVGETEDKRKDAV